MMRDPAGLRIILAGTRRVMTRIRQWLPRREMWYVLRTLRADYVVHWKPFKGLWVTSARPLPGQEDVEPTSWPRPKERSMKRRNLTPGEGLPPVGVSALSVLFGKYPKLREHLTCMAYENGEIRTPGYLWWKTTMTAHVVTLFDPDAGARLDCRASTIDEAWALAEKLLGAEDAPWEHDQYLAERMTKRKKKKGS